MGDPTQALLDYDAAVRAIYDGTPDIGQAARAVESSTLESLLATGRWEDLYSMSVNAPDELPVPVLPMASQANCGRTKVYFVNGILSTPFDAVQAKNLLERYTKKAIAESGGDSNKWEFEYFYNRSGLTDIAIQAFCAMWGFGFGTTVPQVASCGSTASASLRQQAHAACANSLGAPWDLIEAATQYAQQVLTWLPKPGDALRLAARVRSDLATGYRVILVAHSQGNFFAEQALDVLRVDDPDCIEHELLLSQRVFVIAVASPALYPHSDVDGAPLWLTLDHDIILNVPGALPASIENELTRSSASSADLGFQLEVHSFSSSYLGCEESRRQIIEPIAETTGGSNCQCAK
jgi:hypothetical protein